MYAASIRTVKGRNQAIVKVLPFKKYTYKFIEEMVYDVIFCLNFFTQHNKNNE